MQGFSCCIMCMDHMSLMTNSSSPLSDYPWWNTCPISQYSKAVKTMTIPNIIILHYYIVQESWICAIHIMCSPFLNWPCTVRHMPVTWGKRGGGWPINVNQAMMPEALGKAFLGIYHQTNLGSFCECRSLAGQLPTEHFLQLTGGASLKLCFGAQG